VTGQPTVSVVIPALDVAGTIDDQLAALAAQTYAGEWEVVVSDNGSTDATRERVAAWEGRVPGLRVVDSSARRGLSFARNVGVAAARGDLILLCDGDDVVARDWVERMVGALADHSLVTGRIDVEHFNDRYLFAWSGEAEQHGAERPYGFLPYAAGGNLGIRRALYEQLAGFDETLPRTEDFDFGWRAAYAGVAVHYEPLAVIHRRLHGSMRALARTRYLGGRSEPALYRRHGRRGMPRDTSAQVRETWAWLLRELPNAARRREARPRWVAHAATRVGRVVGSVAHRTRFL
jgi:glycosyltransferase involved in cell wall biosynthesis